MFLEPDCKFSIVLKFDEAKSVESRPTFFARSLSMRQQTKLSKALDDAFSHATTEAIFEATCGLLNEYLTGFKNMGSVAPGTDYQEFLSHEEARELLRKVLANQHVTPDEKKS